MPKRAANDLTAEERRIIAACQARIALVQGRQLGQRATRDIDWLERLDKQRHQAELIESCPMGTYAKMARIPAAKLQEQCEQFDFPIGDQIDLAELWSAVHEFLAVHGSLLQGLENNREALECEKLRSQIAQLNHRTELLKLDHAREVAETIGRAEVRHRLKWLSDQLRAFGDYLGKEFGKPAQADLNKLLDRIEHELVTGVLSMEEPIA